ncbi:hypothetical protein BH10ACT1_BH10ACT1_21640 [soil metagenome]
MLATVLRPATTHDLPFLWAMLAAAAGADGPPMPPEEVATNAELRRYLDGWGRDGDVGLVATDDHGEALGAAWYRTFTADEPGYAFVDEATPELAIALGPAARGKGLGHQLVGGLLDQAHADGVAQLSLSVRATNAAAVKVYENTGFVTVGTDAEGLHLTMVAPTSRPA